MLRFPLLILLLPGLTFAAPQETDNIGHRRHEHRWGEPDLRTPGSSRFHTNRDGLSLLLPLEEDAFQFVVFGDRTGGPAEGVAVLADAVRDTNLLHPDLVMTVGDLVQGYNQTDAWMPQMREFKGIMDRLLCPWFPVAGNHDVYWRGEGRPAGEHEASYEMHFGPLWYAFEHKNSWFIALYSDEGDPATGKKDFTKPECQKMSEAQFEWLRGILEKAKGAEHVFLFLHHPRWLGGNYGKDWDRVHELLRAAGNVTAVFAGHIHYMRHDQRDNIEYITLATVGGGQDGLVPSMGWLHQFHVVTVRKGRIDLSCLPVGGVMDVRELKGNLVEEAEELARHPIDVSSTLSVQGAGEVRGRTSVTFENPTQQSLEVSLALESADSRWRFSPDHVHGSLAPGQRLVLEAAVQRDGAPLDDTFRMPQARVAVDLLQPGARYPLPDRTLDLPLGVVLDAPNIPGREMALDVRKRDAFVAIPDADLALPDGPLSVECWLRAENIGKQHGLVAKTESSEFALSLDEGRPGFFVHLDGKYAIAQAKDVTLERNRWYHLAGVFDGQEMRLYLDGRKIASQAAHGVRTSNRLPLIIGGDVNNSGGLTSPFAGYLDAVHVASGALYTGDSFTPPARAARAPGTVLLLNMDALQGPWLFDEAALPHHPRLGGGAKLAETPGHGTLVESAR
ncbi:MAG: LamG-like jellyroll fold domain-containing protein [Planctomycetota bacterium]